MSNLSFIQQQMIRYGISSYFALGLLGNICNCIVFTRHSNRRASSSVYFLSLSIIAIIYLNWSISPLLSTLNYVDLQTTSLVYCKLRIYVGHVLGQCLRYVVILICIDRFLATRGTIRTRSLNSVLLARKLVFIVFIVASTIAIHLPILMDIRGNVCGMFGLYKIIYSIYQIILVGILPPVLMSIFSILTIRSLHQRHGLQTRLRRRDRYLMRMVIAEVVINIVTSIPYSSNLVYSAITSSIDKSAQRLEIESFISFLTQFLAYLISVAPFYLFMLISKPFRDEVINLLVEFWKLCMVRHRRVMPNTQRNAITTING